MEIYKKQTLAETFSVYFDRRMIKILLLGAISGFPWVIIGSSLSLWLKEDGLSRSTIGWAGLIFAVYAFNYLWAPIIDRIRIPWLTNKIGHRRGWIVTMQAIILISLICWSIIDPTTNLALVITVGLIIAVASATQDITVDALRIEQIGVNEGSSMQAGAAMAVVGWWTGYKLGGVIALNAAEYLQQAGFENYWQITFLILGVIIIACNIGLMFINENLSTDRSSSQRQREKLIEQKLGTSNIITKSVAWITGTVVGPISSFFKKNGFFKFLSPEDVSNRKQIFKVSYTGYGWLLVKKGVFESLEYPWVQPTWFDEDGIYEMTTTDCGFMHRAAEKGHHTYIDPTIIVGHEKSEILMVDPRNLEPKIDFIPNPNHKK